MQDDVTKTNYYLYDESGVCGMISNGVPYYFRKNITGDVVAIYTATGSLVCRYVYSAWGEQRIYDGNGNTLEDDGVGIWSINPFRYRGYYWDREFGLYYLQSRYYDPVTGRFISPDDIEYLDPTTVGGLNLYAYCGNNPVMYADSSGHSWDSFWNGVGNWFKDNWEKAVSVITIVAGFVTLFTPLAQTLSGFLLSAGISSLVGGFANESAGGSFRAGWIGGLISGAIGAISIPSEFGEKIGLGGVGGFIGNLTTALIDKYFYGRDINVTSLIFTTALSTVAGAVFSSANIPFAFEAESSNAWYTGAKIGWAACISGLNAFRSWIVSFVSGIF